jgi:hypothetical protein
VSILGEYRATVAPLVSVHKVNSLLKSVNTHYIHNRSKDLLIVASHTLFAVIDDSGTNPVAVRVSFNLDTTTIQKEGCVLLSISDESLNVFQVSSVIKRSNIEVFVFSTISGTHLCVSPTSTTTEMDMHL